MLAGVEKMSSCSKLHRVTRKDGVRRTDLMPLDPGSEAAVLSEGIQGPPEENVTTHKNELAPEVGCDFHVISRHDCERHLIRLHDDELVHHCIYSNARLLLHQSVSACCTLNASRVQPLHKATGRASYQRASRELYFCGGPGSARLW